MNYILQCGKNIKKSSHFALGRKTRLKAFFVFEVLISEFNMNPLNAANFFEVIGAAEKQESYVEI